MQNTLDAVLKIKGRAVHNVSPKSTVLEAVRQMNAEKIGSLVVCEEDSVVGMFTERDVLCRVVDGGQDPASTTVEEVMSTKIVTVQPTTKVEDAMAVITETRCRHLPVIEEGNLVGLVSIGDLTRWVGRHQEVHIQDLVNYITNKYPA